MQRRLSVILSADVAGYGAMMERDEAGTLARVKAAWAQAFEPRLAAHQGRVVKLMGDGALIEFASAVSAVACAQAIQADLAGFEPKLAEAQRLRFRMGVNLGDVIVEGDDIFGEGVNVAARVQSVAPPGGVALSRTVRDHVAGKLDIGFADLGEHVIKDNERPVHVFALIGAGHGAATPKPAPRLSICVLPFTNMSGDPEQDYFADGVSEDIITDLSKISALAVTARNSAFAYKGQNVDINQVARKLGVSHVLEGSVRKAGNRVRITAQLIDGASNNHLWAERYDREMGDIFALQDEISQAIVTALKLQLHPQERHAIEARSTTNPDAYKYYLMARQFVFMGNERQQELVVRLCRKAVETDPHYARAWATLAIGLWLLERRSASTDNGRAAAERAIALDPNLAEAHAALAHIIYSDADYAEAAKRAEFAVALDPECFEARYIAAIAHVAAGDNASAIPHFEKSFTLRENDFMSPAMAVQAFRDVGDREGERRTARLVVERVERVVAREPDHGRALGYGVGGLAVLGEKDRALDWMESALLLDPDNGTLVYNLACAMVQLRAYDKALDLLERHARDHNPSLSLVKWWEVDSDLDPIRDQPRFIAWLEGLKARHAADKGES